MPPRQAERGLIHHQAVGGSRRAEPIRCDRQTTTLPYLRIRIWDSHQCGKNRPSTNQSTRTQTDSVLLGEQPGKER